ALSSSIPRASSVRSFSSKATRNGTHPKRHRSTKESTVSFNNTRRPQNRPPALTARAFLRITVFVLLLDTADDARAEVTHRLASPDRRIQITVQLPGAGSTERPRWSATFRGKPVLTDCRLGLQTADA